MCKRDLAEMGTGLKGLPEGGMGGRKDTPRCFLASTLRKQQYFFFFQVVWELRGLNLPSWGPLLSAIPKG